MKPLSIFLLLGLVLLQSFKSDTKITAIEFNDAIIGEQNKIIELTLEMIDYFETDLDKSEEVRILAVQQCTSSITALTKLETFKGGENFKSAALALITFYRDIFSNEFEKMISILKKGENITEEDLEYLSIINDEINAREFELDANLEKAQSDFAIANNFTIDVNEYQDEIDEIDED